MPRAEDPNFEQGLAEFDLDLREDPRRSSRRIWFEGGGWMVLLDAVVVALGVVAVLDHEDLLAVLLLVPGLLLAMVSATMVALTTNYQGELRRRRADGWQACGDCRGRGRSVEVDPLVPPFCEARREDVRIVVCPTCRGYRWVKATGGIADGDQGDSTS